MEKITITIERDGEKVAQLGMGEGGAPDIEPPETDGGEMTDEEAERVAVVSDLANVCDYLEDSEVIKIRLIVQKAEARKERAERDG